MNTHELWQAVLGELELSLSKANFTTWFKNTFISSLEGERVVISVPNTFTKAWLEKKYNTSILKSIQNVSALMVKEIVYKVDVRSPIKQTVGQPIAGMYQSVPQPLPQNNFQSIPASMIRQGDQFDSATAAVRTQNTDGKLNSKYTFDTFIVGKGSELAHAAAVAVVENPGTKYNPLFIYGGVGLGKTHLLQGIGNAVRARQENAKILYVTCERFTNDFIHAVKSGRGKDFKDTYRNVDVLLIDDIQFLTGKDGTQEEFFHTFNALHQANKQVVLTSDRPPKQIPALEHRLISRFEWGMMADISSPDYETRIAILETKCRERNYDLDPNIISFIADTVQSNVRELEGALNKIIAYHQFKNTRPTLESSQQLLSSFGPAHTQKNVNPKNLIQTVASYFDVTVADMLGRCREKRLAFPRQIIMYLMREELRSSYPTIGNELGGRDHTTAMHAYDKIRRELENNTKLQQDLDQIKQRLYT
ncbi:chromosomal replication initiator protein DnaA [Patescibacteria group bacterium]|nr:chromosomal replication initiator protein DnaA [Patescibacteria group bacterium]MBU1915527.1 chromosomal replication initiator protein DnaA [Patescibacteria group bacterium]